MSEFRREQLHAPPLWHMQHFHRWALPAESCSHSLHLGCCGNTGSIHSCPFVPAAGTTTQQTKMSKMNRSEKELRPFRPAHRIFDPPVDKRSPGKRQSRATPIPASYVYSPSLVPRPPDWPSHVQASMLRSECQLQTMWPVALGTASSAVSHSVTALPSAALPSRLGCSTSATPQTPSPDLLLLCATCRSRATASRQRMQRASSRRRGCASFWRMARRPCTSALAACRSASRRCASCPDAALYPDLFRILAWHCAMCYVCHVRCPMCQGINHTITGGDTDQLFAHAYNCTAAAAQQWACGDDVFAMPVAD